MSSITHLMRRLVGRTVKAPRVAANPERMSLRDWADLPTHHPLS